MNANVLRSESTGSIHIKSADPQVPPAIRFNFLSTEHDRAGIVAVIRKGRELMATSPLREITGEEIAPGAKLQSDEELLDWVRNNAETTYHPVGTCKMGSDGLAVVDRELRVHGIDGLARCRCFDHADADQRQHQCTRDHDRREVRRDGAGRSRSPQGCRVTNRETGETMGMQRTDGMQRMDFETLVQTRKSVRGFKKEPVPRAVIEDIIEVAKRAPSSMNTQPWHIHVLTGEPLEELRRRNMEEMIAGAKPKRDIVSHGEYQGVHRGRQVDIAKKLFAVMGIARDDKPMRQDWVLRGFRQFDAPVSLVLTYDKILDPGAVCHFDLGALCYGIVLAAWDRGLGSVINGQGIMRSDIVREVANIPEEEIIMTCVAMGYPDDSFPANAVRSDRESNGDFVRYVGFAD